MSRKSGGQNSKHKQQVVSKRKVDVHFAALNQHYRHPANRVIQYMALPVFFFAVLGLVWMIPFPEIAFLKARGYDTFLNWGSFFIAGFVYYYLRLAPTLSYAVLLTVGLFAFFIVQLEYIEQAGGPAVWLVCAILLLVALAALAVGKRMERYPVSMRSFLRLLALGPIWLWHFVFKRLNIPY
ncbi:hypothetical protein ACFOET_19345 [Parapedobacter deserti]|uniref:DUF962 domain-containing protein n=1 Tax=Parapedobacter deserti TaxID=1912957 RepID=A0ABV7JX10_9SPHI